MNLIERLTIGSESDPKIPIHAFCGALNEYRRGKLTGADIVGFFNLDTAQTTQATMLKDLFVAAPNKAEFVRVLKDLLYMGESNIHANYRSAVFVQSRLETEVTDQGGTLP